MQLELAITSSQQADLARMPLNVFYRYTSQPEIQAVLPPAAPNGQSRKYSERPAVLVTLALDLVRAGIKFPLAASWAVRIAEQLCFDPEAEKIHLEFRRNGALYFFTTDKSPEAAGAAGPARWRLTFDLAEYRAAFLAAAEAGADEHVLA